MPKATELVAKVSVEMYKQIMALNQDKPLNIPGSGLEKVKNMDRVLVALESKREKAMELEREKVQSKIESLTQMIQTNQNERIAQRYAFSSRFFLPFCFSIFFGLHFQRPQEKIIND